MPTLKLTVGQVIELVKQLPQEDKYAVLRALDTERDTGVQDKLKQEKEQQLIALSSQRGLDWHRLSEDDRDVLASTLHKDR